MDKTVSIEIPAPPDGHEAFFNDTRDFSPCVFELSYGRWTYATQGNSTKAILARKKRTLADWANEQRLFQSLAEMAGNSSLIVDPGHMSRNGWYLRGTPEESLDWVVHLEVIPDGLPHVMLKLVNGKWELA